MKSLARLLLCLSLSLPTVLTAQHAPIPNPATEATLKTYFEVCHFATTNRLALDKQYAIQQKSLPPWFPIAVWNEAITAVENIDVVALSIPIYQRYLSETAARNATLILLTPAGQAMLNKAYAETMKNEASGDDSLQAHLKAIEALKYDEDLRTRSMVETLTPKERQEVEVFARSPEWKRINDEAPDRSREFATIYQTRQEEVFKQVLAKHQQEVHDAHRAYLTTHPDAK